MPGAAAERHSRTFGESMSSYVAVVELVYTPGLNPGLCEFESRRPHQIYRGIVSCP